MKRRYEPTPIVFERMIGPAVVGLWQMVHSYEWQALAAVRHENTLLASDDADADTWRRAYLAVERAGNGDYWFARQLAELLERAIANHGLRAVRRPA